MYHSGVVEGAANWCILIITSNSAMITARSCKGLEEELNFFSKLCNSKKEINLKGIKDKHPTSTYVSSYSCFPDLFQRRAFSCCQQFSVSQLHMYLQIVLY